MAAAAVAADRDRRFKPPHEKFPSPLDRPSRDLDLYAFTGCRCRSLASGFDRVVVKRLVIGVAITHSHSFFLETYLKILAILLDIKKVNKMESELTKS